MNYCYGCMNTLGEREQVCPVCGYDQSTPPLQFYYLDPGTVIRERYLIGKVIGYGGFGITYVGYDLVLKRKVAVKEYYPSDYAVRVQAGTFVQCSSQDSLDNFRRGLEGFKKEARSLARLGDIRGVVKVFDCVEENGTAYIIMEFLEGKSLKEILADRRRIPYAEARQYVFNILFTLSKIHREGVIHRDIAPDNVFILKKGNEVKLIDFGSARYAFSEQSHSVSVILKPGYAPIEQYVSNSSQGPWTDLYSVGATFYRMVTGDIPIEATNRAINDHLIQPSQLCRIPQEGNHAIMKAMQVRKEMRYQTAEAFMQDLMMSREKPESESGYARQPGKKGVKLEPFAGTPGEMKKQKDLQGEAPTVKYTGDEEGFKEVPEHTEKPNGKNGMNIRLRIGLAALVLGILAAAAAGSFYVLKKQDSLNSHRQLYELSQDEAVKSGRVLLRLHCETGERNLVIRDLSGSGALQLYIARSSEQSREELKDAFSAYALQREGEKSFIGFAYDGIGYDVDFSEGGYVIDAPDPGEEDTLYDLVFGSRDSVRAVYRKISFRNVCMIRLEKKDSGKPELVLSFQDPDKSEETYKVYMYGKSVGIEAAETVNAYRIPDISDEKVFSIRKGGRILVCGDFEKADGSRWKLIRRNADYGFVPADAVFPEG